MPPKTTKKKATTMKKTNTAKSSTANPSTVIAQKENESESIAAKNASTTAGSKRGRAESVGTSAAQPKKPKISQSSTVSEKADAEDSTPKKSESAKTRDLDTATKDELDFIEEILSYFDMPAMTAAMDVINIPNTPRPDTLPEMSKLILEELENRFRSGESIEKDAASIKKVEQKFEAGEYDEDPDGFEIIVRRRLNKVEEMVERMTSMYLKDIIEELGFFSKGGSNRDLAGEIVGFLTFKAQNKSKLAREYRIVKSYYVSSYGCCGTENDSLDEGDEDGDEGSDFEEDNHCCF